MLDVVLERGALGGTARRDLLEHVRLASGEVEFLRRRLDLGRRRRLNPLGGRTINFSGFRRS